MPSPRLIALMLTAGALTFNVLPGEAAPRVAPDYPTEARKMDESRARIFAPNGATIYSLDQRRLRSQLGGENRSIGSTLLQAPGVARGDGQVRMRWQ